MIQSLQAFDKNDLLIGVLRNDPRVMSHVWGQELYGLQQVARDRDRAQDRVDQILADLCERYRNDPETVCRILRTMIVTYDIEIDTQIQTFPALHDLIFDYLARHHREIEVYQ